MDSSPEPQGWPSSFCEKIKCNERVKERKREDERETGRVRKMDKKSKWSQIMCMFLELCRVTLLLCWLYLETVCYFKSAIKYFKQVLLGRKYARNRHQFLIKRWNGRTSSFTFRQHYNVGKQHSMKVAKRIINRIINEQALED